jgi:hypothetical protein
MPMSALDLAHALRAEIALRAPAGVAAPGSSPQETRRDEGQAILDEPVLTHIGRSEVEVKRQQRQSVQDQDAGAEDRGGDKGGDEYGHGAASGEPGLGPRNPRANGFCCQAAGGRVAIIAGRAAKASYHVVSAGCVARQASSEKRRSR